MAEYEYQTNIHKKKQRWHLTHRVISLLFVLGIIFIVCIGYVIWRNVAVGTDEVTGTAENSVYMGESREIVQSDHFSFTSTAHWEFVRNDSTIPTKYVYKSTNNGIVKHELTVYLNEVPSDLKVTYILPVSSPDGLQLIPGELSPKCSVPKGASQNPVRQIYKGISYICIPDRLEMIVGAGQTDNGYKIILTDRDDNSSTIGFFYRDLTATPTIETFTELVRSFKLK